MQRKRQHLIDTAIRLFVERGFHATGIDLIAKEAQVSKKTMYQYFGSKEALIAAALSEHDQRYAEQMGQTIAFCEGDPIERVLAIFDVGDGWFAEDTFYGCLFMNALSEYETESTTIKTLCAGVKSRMREFIEGLVVEAGVVNANAVASSIAMLYEGAIVKAHSEQDPQAASLAQQAARVILTNAEAMAS